MHLAAKRLGRGVGGAHDEAQWHGAEHREGKGVAACVVQQAAERRRECPAQPSRQFRRAHDLTHRRRERVSQHGKYAGRRERGADALHEPQPHQRLPQPRRRNAAQRRGSLVEKRRDHAERRAANAKQRGADTERRPPAGSGDRWAGERAGDELREGHRPEDQRDVGELQTDGRRVDREEGRDEREGHVGRDQLAEARSHKEGASQAHRCTAAAAAAAR